jgi:AcrR family transcriptional regulator
MIADDLGVSQSTVMHYFKNRTVLIQAILNHGAQSNLGIVSKMIQIHDSALTRLWKYFSGTLAWTRMRPEEASIVLYLYYISSVDSSFSELYRQMLSRARTRVLEWTAPRTLDEII